jgi:hypothetical protein
MVSISGVIIGIIIGVVIGYFIFNPNGIQQLQNSIKLNNPSISLETLNTNPSNYIGKEVTVYGTVTVNDAGPPAPPVQWILYDNHGESIFLDASQNLVITPTYNYTVNGKWECVSSSCSYFWLVVNNLTRQ